MICRPDPDLVRKGELMAIPPSCRDKYALELLEIDQRLRAKLDRKMAAERHANEVAETLSEGRIYPQNQSMHDD
jgi:hypothetical protein